METKPQRLPIPGFSDYSITNDGRVFNKHGMRLRDYDCNGYRRISLKNDAGKRVGIDIHRLVAMTYIGPIPQGQWINHENGVKSDNRVSNLRIDSPSYNHKHAFTVLDRTRSSEPEQAEAMSVLASAGWSHSRIASLFGCSQSNVTQVLGRRNLV